MKKLLTFLTLLTLSIGVSWAATVTATINFGPNATKIDAASVTGTDSKNNSWTITTVGTTSFTNNNGQEYSQVGSSSKPATSITFTTTLPESVEITSMKAKFGGNSGTAGTVTLKVGDTSIGTGNLNATNDVTVSSTTTATGSVLTVTVTNISKGVKCYYIQYSYDDGTSSTTYDVNFGNMSHGTVTTDPTSYEAGDIVSLTVTPDPGYQLGTLSVTGDDSGNNITITDNQFVMPEEDVTVNATFNAIPSVIYKRITNETNITDGAKYILVYEDGGAVNGSLNGKYLNSVSGNDITISNGTATIANTTVAPFILSNVGTNEAPVYIIKMNGNSSTLLGLSGNSNNNMAYFDDATKTNAQWTISIVSNNAIITNVGQSSGSNKIFYNSNSGQLRFSNYAATSTTTKSIYLYKEDDGTPPATEYNITVNQPANNVGVIEADYTKAAQGVTVTLTATPAEHYTFTSWNVYKTGDETTTVTVSSDNKFSMPGYPVTVEATFTAMTPRNISVTNGSADKSTAYAGETVTLTPTFPSADKVVDWANTGVTPSNLEINHSDYTFEMPDADVSVTFAFKDAPVTAEATYIFNTTEGIQALGLTPPTSGGTDLSEDASYTSGLVTMTTTYGSAHTRIWYNSNTGYDLRLYGSSNDHSAGTLTFAVPTGYLITQMDFTYTGTQTGSFTASEGEFNTGCSTWTGSTKSVTLTATAQNQIKTITVTYEKNEVKYAITRTIKTDGSVSYNGGWLGDWNCENDYTNSPEYNVYGVAGNTIQFKAGTNMGYNILKEQVTAVDGNENPIELTVVSTDDSGIVFSFTMPETTVAITANFTSYRPELRMAGRFNGGEEGNGENSRWVTDSSGPKFTYDPATDKYTIDVYFIGASHDNNSNSDGDYFYFRADNSDLKSTVGSNDNDWITEAKLGQDLSEISYSPDGNNVYHGNFRIIPGVYKITINGTRSTVRFDRTDVTIALDPTAGERPIGTKVSAKSNLAELITAIKANDTGAKGNVSVKVCTDGTSFNQDEITLESDQTVYGKAWIGNISSDVTSGVYTVYTAYTATITEGIEGGFVSFDADEQIIIKDNIRENDNVIVYVTPKSDNWELTTLNYTVEGGEPVEITQTDGVYSFAMPAGNVTINAVFTWIGGEVTETTYELVTSIDEIEVGAKYIIVNEEAAKALVDAYKSHLITIVNHTATISSTYEIAEFELGNGATEGTYTFKFGDNYLNNSSSTSLAITGTSSDPNINWTISIGSADDYFATITSPINRLIHFLASAQNYSGDFRAYSINGNSSNVQLYREATPITEVNTLAELCRNGEVGTKYTIKEGLQGIYQLGTSVWYKDDNKSIYANTPNASDKDYKVNKKNQKDFDQSNWIEVVFVNEANASRYSLDVIKNITGRFVDKANPKIILKNELTDANIVPSDVINPEYAPNPYMPANFMGSQAYNGETYFFAKPKPQEVVTIMYAVWDDENEKFIMPDPEGEINHFGFTGEFVIDLSKNVKTEIGGQNGLNLEDGSVYSNFTAIIHAPAQQPTVPETTNAPRMKGNRDGGYVVYPTDLTESNEQTVTAISTVEIGNGEVKSVKYVNVAGIVSDTPFQGVNIVVTEYSDGSRTTTKMLRK